MGVILASKSSGKPGMADYSKTVLSQASALVRNEQRKLSATWCNTLATAVVTAGTFAPLAAIFYGLASTTLDYHHLRSFAGFV
jgi:hypothetical protein